MGDTPVTHDNLSLFGRQVFEYSVETDASGNKVTETLPGFYEIYTQVDGVDVVLDRRKAPGLLSDIAKVKRAQDAGTPTPPAASTSQPQTAQPTTETPPPVEPTAEPT